MELFFDASTPTPKVPADIVLEVAKLPAGRRSVAVTLAYLVREDGAIRRCSVITSSGSAAFRYRRLFVDDKTLSIRAGQGQGRQGVASHSHAAN